MAKSKKFDYRVVQDGTSWTGEIIRRKTAREIVVSKKQEGFETEIEAQTWAKRELKEFLEKLDERNKRRSTQRELRNK